MRLLRSLPKEEGATVVLVSHDERLREVADRVLWLEDGQLRALEALVRDPVCGMLLDPAQAPATFEEDELLLLARLPSAVRGREERRAPSRGDVR